MAITTVSKEDVTIKYDGHITGIERVFENEDGQRETVTGVYEGRIDSKDVISSSGIDQSAAACS